MTDSTSTSAVPSMSIKDKITERIAASTTKVQEQFIDLKANEDAASRVAALSEAYAAVDKLRKDFQRIDRPDVVNVDRQGKPVGEGVYSKSRAENIKKFDDAIQKWEDALGLAWDGDFKKLREVIKSPPKVSADEKGSKDE